MKNTKENILTAALHLFAQNGYEAVAVSEIASALGITKGALYKHYASKREIFDSIVARMEQLDAQRAAQFELPEGVPAEMEAAYRRATLQQLVAFSEAQFRYWTQEDFPSCFRRMLTLEQYRSEEMRALYQQYLVAGPLGYVTDLFRAWGFSDAQRKAVAFYAPLFLFYSLSDGASNKAAAAALAEQLERICKEWEARHAL